MALLESLVQLTEISRSESADLSARALIFSEFTRLAQERGAVNLSQGLPEPLSNQLIREQMLRSVDAEGWAYADPRGLSALRESVASLYALHQRAPDVVVTSGCTEALLMALWALKGAYGGRVAVLEPFYPYYPGFARLVGLEYAAIPMRNSGGRFEPDWQRIEEVARGGARILLLNSPHNPTGWALSRQDLAVMEALARKYGIAIVVDHAYAGYVYDEQPDLVAELLHRVPESTWVAGTASKCLSAPGLRVGWLLCPEREQKLALELHLHLTYCQPPPLQFLVSQLLNADSHRRDELNRRYERKRNELCAAVRFLGLDVARPEGGHFLVADYRNVSGLNSRQFALYFTERYGVTPLPVDPFYLEAGSPQVRFSFAAPLPDIETACDSMLRWGAWRKAAI